MWWIVACKLVKGGGEGAQPARRNKSNAVDELATRRQHALHVCSSLANILSKCVTVKGRGTGRKEEEQREERGEGEKGHIIASYDLFIGTTR